MVEGALRASGLRTGLYTSPHLLDFRERIRLDGQPISEDALLAAAAPLWDAIEESGATFFEATTAIAFHALARAGVDVAVVEVGLGGRLDATNVIAPDVCAITRIDLDHGAYLGDSLAEVAREKAGILKPGVPVAIAAGQEPEVWRVLRARAAEIGAPVAVAEVVGAAADDQGHPAISGPPRVQPVAVTALGEVPLRPGAPGAHHLANAAVAAHALALLPPALRPGVDAVAAGIATGLPPGRFQRLRAHDIEWILDVAHNPAGMRALAVALVEERPARPVVALVGIVADKDWRSMLEALAPAVDHLVLTSPPGVPPERRWDPQAAVAGSPGNPPATRAYPSGVVSVVPEFDEAIEAAVRRAAPGPDSGPSGHARASCAGGDGARASGTVLVAGSFHTVAAAIRRIGEGSAARPVSVPIPLARSNHWQVAEEG